MSQQCLSSCTQRPALQRLTNATYVSAATQLKGLHLQLNGAHQRLQADYAALYDERVRASASANNWKATGTAASVLSGL